MSDPSLYIAGAALTVFGLVLFLPDLIDRYRIRRTRKALSAASLALFRDALDRAIGQRDRAMARSKAYERLYHDAVKTNAALLEHIGDEREAAAAQAMVANPAYFEAKAAREAASIDREWFNLSEDL